MVSIKNTFSGIKTYVKQPAISGQILAQIPRAAIGIFSSELGNKLINGLVGAIGALVNHKYMKKEILESLFANMMFSSLGGITAGQIREMRRNAQDLSGGFKGKSFKTAFGALIEEPHEVVGAIKSILPRFSGKLSLGSLKGSFRDRFLSSDKMIKALDSSAVTTYTSSFANALDEDDIVTY